MTEKDNFTLDNPIMFDKKNGRCICIPIPYAKDMAEKRFRVFKFPDVDKFGVSDDIVEVTVAFCDKKWEADYLCDLLNDLNKDKEEQSKCILRLVKENEKLKSTVKEVLGLLSDEVDLFSDKATEHDINAYVELNQLDNKDAYYMATATKKAIKMLKELQ